MFDKLKTLLKKENIIPLLLLFLVVISGIVTIFTYSAGLNGYDGFDYLEDIYWAKATLDSKSLVSPDYNYVYIIPFGANLIMAPFVAMLGTTLLANQLGMTVYFVIYLLTVYYLADSLFEKTDEKLYFIAIVTMFVLTLIGDSLLHHILAYGIGFVCFMGELASLINICKNNSNNLKHYILLGIFCSWSSLNGLSTIALSTLALFGSITVFCYINRINVLKIGKNILNSFVIIGVTTIIGFIIFRIINNGRDFGSFVFCNRDLMIQKPFNDFFKDLFNIFSFDPEGVPFFSARGILYFTKLFFAFVIFVIPIFYIFKKDNKTQTEVFVTIACSILFMICYAMWLFGAKASERTLYNGILALLIMCGIVFNNWFCKVDKREVFMAKSILAILITLLSFRQIVYSYKRGNETVNSRRVIIDALKENNLSFGYSTSFLYARQLNVISNGEVETVLALYSEEENKFEIESTSTFSYERSKPTNINRTYVIVPDVEIWFNYNDNKEFDDLIDHNVGIINLNECVIFIFDMKDFDKVFTFE